MAPAARPARWVVLVDGSNVARSDAWGEAMRRERAEVPHEARMPLVDPRQRLLDWILAWTTSSGADVVVVFDGEGPLGAGPRQFGHAFLVVGSGTASGDDVVEQEAARLHREAARFHVVTDDHALADVAGAHAERTWGVDAFVAELAAPAPDAAALHDVPGHAADEPPTRLADTLDDDVRSTLERLRRGGS